MQNFLRQVVTIAQAAGALIRRDFAEPIVAEQKSDGSVVTKTDRAAENLIRIGLSQLAPYIPFVGEESVEAGVIPNIEEGEFWCVDPLDGTRHFTEGRADSFCVLIGLVREGMPVLGVAHMPMADETYAGLLGDGAWHIQAKYLPKVLKPSAINPPRIIVENRNKHKPTIGDFLAAHATSPVTYTDNPWPFLALARGEADLCPSFSGSCEWDTAATHAILRTLGIEVYGNDQAPLRYGKLEKKFVNPHTLAAYPSLLTNQS